MYMIVVITLVVSIMGIFTMGANRQASQMINQQQPSIAAMMQQWHTVAYTMASKWVLMSSATTTGCSLTDPTYYRIADWTGALATGCVGYGAVVSYIRPTSWGASECNGNNSGPPNTTQPCGVPLPAGWQMPPYVFYSIVYSVTGTPVMYYVLTFVPPTTSATTEIYKGLDNLCLPGRSAANAACSTTTNITAVPTSVAVNATFHGFVQQLKHSGIVPTSLGFVSVIGGVNTLTTYPLGFNNQAVTVAYQVPASVPAGSVGIVTSFTPCSAAVCH